VEAGFSRPLSAAPVADAELAFDDDASPWYTLCQAEAPDRPGLLRSLAAAFAASGVDVHSAHVSSEAGRALDRFELTDQRGRKLDEATKGALEAAVADGVRGWRRRGWSPSRSRHLEAASEQSWHTPETIG
jgi:UTP:GlnB (protein PII) uridylyltransferase